MKRLLSKLRNIEEKVAYASILLLGLSLFGKILGFAKLHLIARFFGISRELDIFWAAFTLPDIVFTMLVVGTVNAALIPVFVKLKRNEDQKVFDQTVNTTIIIISSVLGIFSIGLYLAMPRIAETLIGSNNLLGGVNLSPVLSTGSAEHYKNLYVGLSRLMLVSPFLLSISSILGAYLQSHKRFIYTAVAPLAYNVGIVGGIVLFVALAPQFGIYALGYSVILGSFFHLLVHMIGVQRMGHWERSIELGANKYVFEILTLSVPRVLGLAVEQIAILFNTFWSLTLGAGALSVFKFASSLYVLPIDIISGTFLQALFPHLNDKAHEDPTYHSLRKLYTRAFLLILFLGIPLAVMFTILRIPIVRLAFGAGRYSWSATVATGFVLAFFTPSIIFQTINALNIRTFYAVNNTKTPFIISVVSVIATISLSIMMSNFFSHYHEVQYLQTLIIDDVARFIREFWQLQIWEWFFTRETSFAAVAGLAFGITVGTIIEAITSFIFIFKKIDLKKVFFSNSSAMKKITRMVFAGITLFIVSYGAYKLGDLIFDTTRILGLVLDAAFVSIISLIYYLYVTRVVWNYFIPEEKIKEYLKVALKFLVKE